MLVATTPAPVEQLDNTLMREWRGRDVTAPAGQEHTFLAVLLVWAVCLLLYGLLIGHFGTPWPYCDEWELTPAATGQVPLNLRWLWQPQNEHRAPLTRLEVLLVGWLGSWNLRTVLFTNLAFLGAGSLALLVAARRLRGQSAFSDVFLCLLVLGPGQWASTVYWSYAYAMALGWMCLATAAAATAWPRRSLVHLGIYVILLLVVTLSGGPAGNLWAIGLSGFLLVETARRSMPAAWRVGAGTGALLVISMSGVLLWLIEPVAAHQSFRADSLATLVRATAKLWVCWLGPAVVSMGRWALLVLAIPGVVLLGHLARDLWSRRTTAGRADLGVWAALLPALMGTLAVGVAMGYGRGRYPNLVDSRYQTLLMPIGLITYLLLVSKRTWFVPEFLALTLAVCTGWNWPEAIAWPRLHRERTDNLTREVQAGEKSLTELVVRHGEAVGFPYPKPLLEHMLQLRRAHLCVFKDDSREYPPPPAVWYTQWEAEAGERSPGLAVVADSTASGGKGIESVQDKEPGLVRYAIDVPASARYLLWGQVSVPFGVPAWSVQVDDGPETLWPLSTGVGYHPAVLETPLALSAGKHILTVRARGSGARLDHLQMMTFVQ
jgi:hypothetical protein